LQIEGGKLTIAFSAFPVRRLWKIRAANRGDSERVLSYLPKLPCRAVPQAARKNFFYPCEWLPIRGGFFSIAPKLWN
jgi:hypothetical protein